VRAGFAVVAAAGARSRVRARPRKRTGALAAEEDGAIVVDRATVSGHARAGALAVEASFPGAVLSRHLAARTAPRTIGVAGTGRVREPSPGARAQEDGLVIGGSRGAAGSPVQMPVIGAGLRDVDTASLAPSGAAIATSSVEAPRKNARPRAKRSGDSERCTCTPR